MDSRIGSNLFPEIGFDLDYDFVSSSKPPFHPNNLPLPEPYSSHDLDQANQLRSTSSQHMFLAGPLLSPSSSSQPPTTPDANYSSSRSSNASVIPPQTPMDCKEPCALPRAPAYRCVECPGLFATKMLLERHSKSHRRCIFTCTKGCSKTFTTKKDRMRHEGTIHGDQLVQCETCGRRGRKDNIRRHKKIHDAKSTWKVEWTGFLQLKGCVSRTPLLFIRWGTYVTCSLGCCFAILWWGISRIESLVWWSFGGGDGEHDLKLANDLSFFYGDYRLFILWACQALGRTGVLALSACWE